MTLTAQQAADKAGITVQRLRQHIKAGNLKAQRFGARTWTVESQDLATFRRVKRSPGRPAKVS